MKRIFALDIGTRKILGLVMEQDDANGSYRVVASKMLNHSTRAMLDGQIHDVTAVARTISQIKAVLEEELNTALPSAAVAAAGRALETRQGSAERSWPVIREINHDDVVALEFQAVQSAQRDLQATNNLYLCAGYSATQYFLEEQEIGSLVGQFGSRIRVKVIATFLPRVVVDGLFSALKKSDLDLHSMTLEPIAALSVAIPDSMRILNLALVDIGAGTSDIALIRDGNIFAYAMVAQGGDGITETLGKALLLDFNSAEELKCRINQEDPASYRDILGNQSFLTREEFTRIVQPSCASMVNQIAESIMALNAKAPDAVICIGGGSMTPALTEMLAESLELPLNRVGIKHRVTETLVECHEDYLTGPQGITPVGIAYEAFRQSKLPIMRIVVNQRDVMLWNVERADVARALLDAGIQFSQIYGRPGMGKTIEVNGELKVFQGTMGSPPVLLVNKEPAQLSSWVKDGDVIDFEPGHDGVDASVVLTELVRDMGTGSVQVNGVEVALTAQLLVDGVIYAGEDVVPDRAQVELIACQTVKDCLLAAGVEADWLQEKQLTYYLHGEGHDVEWLSMNWTLNGTQVDLEQTVRDGDRIDYTQTAEPTIGELIPLEEQESSLVTVWVNQEPVTIQLQGIQFLQNGQHVSAQTSVHDGDSIVIQHSGLTTMIVSDVFASYRLENQASKRLVIKVDGEAGGFTTPISPGSKIELFWV